MNILSASKINFCSNPNRQDKTVKRNTQKLSREQIKRDLMAMQAAKIAAEKAKPDSFTKSDKDSLPQKEIIVTPKIKRTNLKEEVINEPIEEIIDTNSLKKRTGIQTLTSFKKTDSPVALEEYVREIEDSIDFLEKTILCYHSKIKKMLFENKKKTNIIDDKGTTYNVVPKHYARINQTYQGTPFDYNWHIEGDNRIDRRKQFAQALLYGDNSIRYCFDFFNLDDYHSNTYADISCNDTIKEIMSAKNWLSDSPERKFLYSDDGKLKEARAEFKEPGETKGKKIRFIFDEDKKVQKIYYKNPHVDENGELINEEIYIKNKDGEFVKETAKF